MTKSLFNKLVHASDGEHLPFLVIGGHAVIQHGFYRATEDADILVRRSDRAVGSLNSRSLGFNSNTTVERSFNLPPVIPKFGTWI